VEAADGDVSLPVLLRCQGGGPQEPTEDEGLPVLLGDRSAWTKGSTGVRGGVARRGRGVKGEKGEGFGRVEESWGGGAGDQQGARSMEVVADRRLLHEVGERAARVGQPWKKMRELGQTREKQWNFLFSQNNLERK
jgi:hypothetical protein